VGKEEVLRTCLARCPPPQFFKDNGVGDKAEVEDAVEDGNIEVPEKAAQSIVSSARSNSVPCIAKTCQA